MFAATDEILALALVVVYLVDAVWLLGRNEAVVVMSRRGVQDVELGSDFVLAGRRPVLLNPLLPYRVGFRANWSLKVSAEDNTASADAAARVTTALRPVGVISAVAAILGVFGAPLALLTARPVLFLACWLGCVLLVLTGGVLALMRHKALGISRPWIAWYVLVAAVCIPLAGTLARTLAQRTRLQISLPDFAQRFLPQSRMPAFSGVLASLLQGFLHEADEGSPSAQRLQRLIEELRKATP